MTQLPGRLKLTVPPENTAPSKDLAAGEVVGAFEPDLAARELSELEVNRGTPMELCLRT